MMKPPNPIPHRGHLHADLERGVDCLAFAAGGATTNEQRAAVLAYALAFRGMLEAFGAVSSEPYAAVTHWARLLATQLGEPPRLYQEHCDLLMTPDNSGWLDFVAYLEREVAEHGCHTGANGDHHPLTRKLLERFAKEELLSITGSILYLEEHGGRCDCTVLTNVDRREDAAPAAEAPATEALH